MSRRNLVTAIGTSALGLGLVIGTVSMAPAVFAQEATPPAAATTTTTTTQADRDAERAVAYDSFVAALAGNLGADQAAVDAAIRDALTAQIDEQESAGELSTEQAAAARAVIEVTDSPLSLGIGGRGGFGGFGGQHGPEGRGPRGGGQSLDQAPDDLVPALPAPDDDDTNVAADDASL